MKKGISIKENMMFSFKEDKLSKTQTEVLVMGSASDIFEKMYENDTEQVVADFKRGFTIRVQTARGLENPVSHVKDYFKGLGFDVTVKADMPIPEPKGKSADKTLKAILEGILNEPDKVKATKRATNLVTFLEDNGQDTTVVKQVLTSQGFTL